MIANWLRRLAGLSALCLVITGLWAGNAESQESLSSLQGVVRNESGRPIEQAQVVLDPGQGTRELRTDADGRFRFIGVAPGSHRLRVLRIGFQPHDTTVTVAGEPCGNPSGTVHRGNRAQLVVIWTRR